MLHAEQSSQDGLRNGPAAAAIVAAAAGCFAMGVFYVLGNAFPTCNRLLSIYQPAGALSGVSTACCIVWMLVWGVLHKKWHGSDIAMPFVSISSLLLLGGGLLLTFPPIARLF